MRETTLSRIRSVVLGVLIGAAIAQVPTVGADDPAPGWKGAESMALVALAPNPGRCGEPPTLEARFVGDGIDTVGGLFTVTASACIDPETLAVTDLEATDSFADGSLLIAPGDVALQLDPRTCVATNAEPVPFTVAGGTGAFAGAEGEGTYHLALNWTPCNGLAGPGRVWFEGDVEIGPVPLS